MLADRSEAICASGASVLAAWRPDNHTLVSAPGELVIADRDAGMMAKLVKELLDEYEGMGGTPDKRHTCSSLHSLCFSS